jgi:hypothetical protein
VDSHRVGSVSGGGTVLLCSYISTGRQGVCHLVFMLHLDAGRYKNEISFVAHFASFAMVDIQHFHDWNATLLGSMTRHDSLMSNRSREQPSAAGSRVA